MPEFTALPAFTALSVKIDPVRQVAVVCLQREETENRLDAVLIDELTQAFHLLSEKRQLRAVVLISRGKTFCAGVDLAWMMQGALTDTQHNLELAGLLGNLFKAVYDCPVPTIAQIEGVVVGAGLALVCACDVALAGHDSVFSSREVQLGILPALMSPYVINSIGPRKAQYLFLTGHELNAKTAKNWGLLHDFVARRKLPTLVKQVVDDILLGMPTSNRATKQLVRAVTGQAITENVVQDTVHRIAHLRATDEAIAGLKSALQGTLPPWRKQHELM